MLVRFHLFTAHIFLQRLVQLGAIMEQLSHSKRSNRDKIDINK